MAKGAHQSNDVPDDRLAKVLRGAFSGPPTPLKDIPKRGEGRRTNAHKMSAATATDSHKSR